MSQTEQTESKKQWLTPVKFAVIAFTLAIALPFLIQFGISPAISKHNAQNSLDQAKNAYGDLQAVNTKIVTFKGQIVKNANISQKALSTGTEATTPAAFIFDNNKPGKKKTVDIYADFNQQRSRDAIILNKNNLQGLVESGTITLKIHSLPTGSAFTMYASEALAESFYSDPDKSWPFLFELLKLSSTVDTNKSQDIVKMIADTAKTLEVKGVDEKSIKNGTFSSWILSVGDDPRLKENVSPPAIYSDNRLIDNTQINLNSADDLRKAILK